jgi:hypothetical protein
MHEPLASIIISLLAIILVVLIWQAFLLLRIARSLAAHATKQKLTEPAETSSGKSRTTSPTNFERFLVEDPARQQLGKKEQAAAYRLWRKENGLTWNK